MRVAYRPGRSPLHVARASAAVAYLGGLGVVAFAFDHPLVLAAVLASVVTAATMAGVGRRLRPWLVAGLPLALLVVLVNVLVSHEGLTVLVRGPRLPVLGAMDVTLEVLAYGLSMGLRVVAVVAVFGLYSCAVDPDEVLHMLRRLSFRSALTASLATRLVPVLGRSAARLDQARRCRPPATGVGRHGRTARLRERAPVVRAVLADSLERALDVAAALEVRGFGARPARRRKAAGWSRHDIAFAACGLALLLAAAGGRLAGWGSLETYPVLGSLLAAGGAALAALVAALAVAPFLAAAVAGRGRRALARRAEPGGRMPRSVRAEVAGGVVDGG